MLQDVENDYITLYPRFSASGAESRHADITIIRKDGAIEGVLIECNVYDEIYEVGSFLNRASSHEVPLPETFLWPISWLLKILCLTYYNKHYYGDFSDRLFAAARTLIRGVTYNQAAQLARVRDN